MKLSACSQVRRATALGTARVPRDTSQISAEKQTHRGLDGSSPRIWRGRRALLNSAIIRPWKSSPEKRTPERLATTSGLKI